MASITLALPDEQLKKLNELASRMKVIPEELIRTSIEDLVARPDDAVQSTIQYLLEKNQDLYRRLA